MAIRDLYKGPPEVGGREAVADEARHIGLQSQDLDYNSDSLILPHQDSRPAR